MQNELCKTFTHVGTPWHQHHWLLVTLGSLILGYWIYRKRSKSV